jgi:hypothetical protein
MRLKKSSHIQKLWQSNKSTLVKGFTRVTDSMPFKWEDGATTTLLVAVGVAAAVMLSAAIRSGKPAGAPANVQVKTAATMPNPISDKSAVGTSAQTSPVTITGCLEQDNEAFRLKDTTGVDAPKSRSWKSGFLKKKAASIEVVDRANRLQLTSHVGERVVLTGMLVDREMQVRSLRRVAASCKEA